MSGDELGDGFEDYEERLAAFDQHKNDLLRHLQKVCEQRPKTESFNSDTAWRDIRLYAWRYLQEEADAEIRRRIPTSVEHLRDFEEILRKARAALEKVRNPVFLEWSAAAHGSPDFTKAITEIYERKFDELLPGLEMAASRAAEHMRRKKGRPYGSGVLQPEFVVTLEYMYRGITGKPGEADERLFAQFITKFLAALRRETTVDAVLKVIERARKSDRWGRGVLLGKKLP
jgi:hypothetical protein